MTTITVDMKWVRAVGTWQPITKNTGGNYPVLEGVNVMVNGSDIVATVTDRYRIVYSVVPNAGDTTVTDVNVIVPMTMLVSFAAANKNVEDRYPVTIEVSDDMTTISAAGAVLSGQTIRGQYPKVYSLAQEWQPSDDGGVAMFNMKLVADVVKFANPIEGVLTAARRDDTWNSVRGGTNGTVWRFDKGTPETFGVLIQSPKRHGA
jgi:hypothetical protein